MSKNPDIETASRDLHRATQRAMASIEAFVAAARKADPAWARHLDATARLRR